MIKKIARIISTVALLFGAVLLMGIPSPASGAIPQPSPISVVEAIPIPDPVTKDGKGGAVVAEPNILETFGPPGILITTVLTGILMIVKAVNEGKSIDVNTYKERASEAETRSNTEIGKVHKKLTELEKKLDDVIRDRDEYRDTLEQRKAHFTQQVLDMEKRHQRELEDMHTALMIELHVRHKLERLLVENGIEIPDTPPPYTGKMRAEVTPSEEREANVALLQTGALNLQDRRTE